MNRLLGGLRPREPELPNQLSSYFAIDGAPAKWGASAAMPAIVGDFMCASRSSWDDQRSIIA